MKKWPHQWVFKDTVLSCSELGLPPCLQRNDWPRLTPPSVSVYEGNENEPGEAKVADLEDAVGVDEEVAGLDITVHDLGGVEVLDPAQQLVEEHLDVVGREVLRRDDDLVQVRLHQLRDHVDLGKVLQLRRLQRWTKKRRLLASGGKKSLIHHLVLLAISFWMARIMLTGILSLDEL